MATVNMNLADRIHALTLGYSHAYVLAALSTVAGKVSKQSGADLLGEKIDAACFGHALEEAITMLAASTLMCVERLPQPHKDCMLTAIKEMFDNPVK